MVLRYLFVDQSVGGDSPAKKEHATGIEREHHMKLFMPAVVVTVWVFPSLPTRIAAAESPREQLQQLTI